MIGEDPDLEKSGRILNHVVEWDRDGITVEADQRHVREADRDTFRPGTSGTQGPTADGR